MARSRSFGGALAPILHQSLHPSSFLTGSVAGAAIAGLVFFAAAAGLPEAGGILAMSVISVVVVRIAVNSAYGREMGGLFESSGGSWPEVFVAAFRMVVLNLVWAIPFGIVASGMGSVAGGPPTGPAVLLLFAAALVPPLSLILAVGTDSVVAALSPETWRALFSGRADELVTMLAVFVGGLLSTVGAGVVLAAGFGSGDPRIFLFFVLVGTAWGLGVSLHLLGRLVGGFLRTTDDEIGDEAPKAPSAPVGVSGPVEFHPTAFGSTEESGAVPIVRGAAGREDAAHAGANAEGVAQVESVLASLAERPAAVAPVEAERRERLEDRESLIGRLRANERLESEDVEAALGDAESMQGVFGPHPQVLARIAVLAHRLERDDALDAARRAADAARVVSNAGVLADLFEEFGEELRALDLAAAERQRMAASLATREHHDKAIELYAALLEEPEARLPAVKALVKLAEQGLRTEEGAERALRIYEVIEAGWPEHPFAEFIDRGRDEARRRLERTVQGG